MGKLIIELAKFMVWTTLVTMPYQRWGRAQNSPWAKTVDHKTEMQFYSHEAFGVESPDAVEVVPAPGSNQTFTGFGYIAMIDDSLRVGPDPNSKLVGGAQGLDGSASLDGTDLITATTYTFSDGIYNGSSFSILGLNPILKPVRELPVIGGTGLFRMARGYALIQTYSFDTTSKTVIIGFNVTVFHY